jgi:ribokinase
MDKIVVIGSSNTDMVISLERLPRPGETILGGAFGMHAGGKGANQAVAAARLGGRVTFVAKVGNDIFGKEARQLFEREGIDTSFVFTDPVAPSGVALINVDAKGENCISVASGANNKLSVSDIDLAAGEIRQSPWLLLQLETPIETVVHAVNMAWSAGNRAILNPAPAQPLPDELLGKLYLITPNETEAEMLTGIPVDSLESAERAARFLQGKGVANVIITLGSRGAFLCAGPSSRMIPAPVVTAVDTTAAGDVFNGALALCLSMGKTLDQSVELACRAASISVTRAGAQDSAPYPDEVFI